MFEMIVVYILAGVLGLCVGSFLNVVIYRLPNEMNLAKPASHCPKCNYVLRWYDNIPILSYIILGGKCRSCKEPISFRYTAVEILNTVLWLASVLVFWKVSIPYAIISALASSVLVCLAFIDLEHMFVPNVLLWILGGLALVAMIVGIFVFDGVLWYERLIGLAVGAGLFGLIYLIAKIILKKEGMGTGDIIFVAWAGLLLGWKGLLFAILVASVVGSFVLLIIRLVKKDTEHTEYPFIPFLAFGSVLALFVSGYAIDWYMSIFAL